MHFIAAFCFLMYANGIAIFRSQNRHDRVVWQIFAHQFACLISGTAFVLGTGALEVFADAFYSAQAHGPMVGNTFFSDTFAALGYPAHGVRLGGYNWCVPLFFTFGLISACLFGWKLSLLVRDRSDQSPMSWRSGVSLMAVLAGVYLMFTACDHWWFFRGAKEAMAGSAAARMLGADDVPCDGMVLERLETNGARYRCPLALVYGRYKDAPFVPWPSYEEGVSIKLKKGIEKALADAVHAKP